MKVAICFAGMPYYVMQNQGYWLKLKEKYNADVYASLWNEDGVYQEGDTVESFRKAYKPVLLEVDNQEHFLNLLIFLTHPIILLIKTVDLILLTIKYGEQICSQRCPERIMILS